MSKILAISDIHINDWETRDPKTNFRLHQNRIVAQNIIDVAAKEGADIIAICGDLFHKSIDTPQILAETSIFLNTIMSHFQYGFIIWGNHDMNNKTDIQNFIDCPANVMLPPNLYYADCKELVIDNSKIAFCNWKPKFDLSWISQKVDVLFTHATIQYNGGPKVNSQILDDTKFNLAICGDIHYPGQTGKFVSIGIPQQNKLDDSEKQSGVIYDTVTKNWYWTDLNPKDNLMKFRRTPDKLLDGYNQIDNTWYVYQPTNITISGSVDTTKIAAITEVDKIIDKIIIEENFESVHQTILGNCKSLDTSEVDFNFQLIQLNCENWRSIKNMTINFNDGDRILIQGANGAGKSSILSALKYAFCDAKEIGTLKPFIKNGEKSCWTEVIFGYQGKVCCIRRGSDSKNCYCIIDGVKLPYANKSDFEDSMKKKFPFIEYMDAYFFDENHQKFIGDCKDDLGTIISKYLRLDKIDLLNNSATQLYTTLRGQFDSTKSAIKSLTDNLEFINRQISNIILPTRSLEHSEKARKEGLELQDRYQKYQANQNQVNAIKARISNYNSAIQDANARLIDVQSKLISQTEVDKLTLELNNISAKVIEITSNKTRKSELEKEISNIVTIGKNLNDTLANLKPDTCPTCGQAIEINIFNQYKSNLEKQLCEARDKYTVLKSNYDSIVDNIDPSIIARQEEIRSILGNQSVNESTVTLIKSDIARLSDSLLSDTNSLDNLLKNTGEEVKLPEGFLELMSNIATDIQVWINYNNLTKSKANIESDIQSNLDNQMKIEADLNKLIGYLRITSKTGKIYEAIMRKLAQEFSDNMVDYDVITKTLRGKDHLELVPLFKKNGYKVQYNVCSQGQKTLLDIHLLLKITTKNGLLVLDEFLSHLSTKNHELCLEMISKMNVGCILLSSHLDSLTGFYNKCMNLSLINEETQVNIQ